VASAGANGHAVKDIAKYYVGQVWQVYRRGVGDSDKSGAIQYNLKRHCRPTAVIGSISHSDAGISRFTVIRGMPPDKAKQHVNYRQHEKLHAQITDVCIDAIIQTSMPRSTIHLWFYSTKSTAAS